MLLKNVFSYREEAGIDLLAPGGAVQSPRSSGYSGCHLYPEGHETADGTKPLSRNWRTSRRSVARWHTLGEELAEATRRIADCDIIAGIDVRGLLRTLGFDPGERRLTDLGPPQKTRQLNRCGLTLKITVKLLVQGSCGIGQPFGDENLMQRYVSERQHTRLRRRLEADAKSLYALYEYGRLHGAVRLRWGFVDEMLPAPWVHRDEPTLYNLKEQALEQGVPLELVVGSAPGWSDPWSRGQLAFVAKEPGGWRTWIVEEGGYVIDEEEIQRARLVDSASISS